MTKWIIMAILPLALFSVNSQAGKADDIAAAMSANCGKSINKKQAAKHIKKLFLCSPGAKVTVGDCSLMCLKANKGNVAGN